MTKYGVWIAIALLGCGAARSGALIQAREHYAQAEYREAITRADAALSYGTPTLEERANAYLIKAQSHEKLGESAEAVGLYVFLLRNFPNTPHAYQSAAALVRMGQGDMIPAGEPQGDPI